MTGAHETLAWRIANGAGRDERNFQRALGADWIDAYLADWRTGHDVYELASSPAHEIHLEPMRYITGRAS